ncbi:unnamed protein product [Vitrella brassicaformis CCMP3155]|uniref:Uncharacterized protein n=1 Tax=Vitrella brassicaformis (strain CCMP3155) TaxID=1169540 RepID=A0A0G4EMK4_VITBC|nr:unnamed protein product [Vitrella brassicaformis CCMP3155]|eukprot:CEL98209.1 unnamed protein product [Vitrella brassicaformis CCMP3155]
MQRLDAEQKKAKRVMLRIQKRTSKAAFKIQELKHELSHHEKENLKRAADLRDKQWLLENAIPHQKRLRNIEVYPASPLPFEHVDPALVESHVNQMQKQAQDSVAQAAMALALHNDETSASEQRVKAEQDTLKKELDDMEAYKARLEAAKKHIEDEYLAGLTEQLEAQNEEHEEVLNSKEAADIIATSKGFSGLFNVRVSEDLELPDCYTFIEKLDEIDLDEIEGDKARRKAEEKKKKRLKRITDNLGKECNIDKGDCGSSALECVETPVTRLEWEFDQEKRLASFRKAVKQLRHKGKCCLPSLPSTQL